MVVRVHGFDWTVYTTSIMPAFAHWLIDGKEAPTYELYEQTRCAHEEQFLPDPMQRLRIWSRAQAFMATLPRGPHSRREYAKLCSPEQFTALSDRYLQRHVPQLYQNSDAVRSVWSALIEDYCFSWFPLLKQADPLYKGAAVQKKTTVREELVMLLHEAGLGELAQEVGEQPAETKGFVWDSETFFDDIDDLDIYEENIRPEEREQARPEGIVLGQHPNTLHLRGWLAGISVRAMALFEYLACGRRSMPFGYETSEPLGTYIGYLTPDEVHHLANCLHNIQPPQQAIAIKDAQQFAALHTGKQDDFRLVDEILPTHADEFLQAVRNADGEGLGLICSVE
ncbi:MAG: hypothetical protein M3Z24_14035 [Chloroflexota bacterium]|nr:hypothetical protein [Chloroflexota bacterium]